jgi:hypothetical protein
MYCNCRDKNCSVWYSILQYPIDTMDTWILVYVINISYSDLFGILSQSPWHFYIHVWGSADNLTCGMLWVCSRGNSLQEAKRRTQEDGNCKQSLGQPTFSKSPHQLTRSKALMRSMNARHYGSKILHLGVCI